MNRRELLATAAFAGAALAQSPRVLAPRVLKNMGSAGPGLGARIRATGKNWDIVQYCHEKGLGAAHTTLPADLDPVLLKRLANQIEKYDMRLTVGLRTPKIEADLPKYEAATLN